MTVASFARGAAEVLFPPACLACSRALEPKFDGPRTARGLLCDECNLFLRPLSLERACPRCGVSPHSASLSGPGCVDCERLPATFREARSAFSYLSPAGQIVRNMKYRNSPFLAHWLVALAWEPLDAWLRAAAKEAIISPVPMYPWRELRRGYNQAEGIARELGNRLNRPVLDGGVFVRLKAAKPQARFHSREERLSNLSGCFHVKQRAPVDGQRVLLVDDVMTTGATVAHAAGALLEAGAKEVFVFTIVRARFGDDRDEHSSAP